MSEEWQARAEAAEGQPACSPDLVPIDWVEKWRARAEAAEARVRELEADLNDAHAHHYYLRDRAEAAETRMRELEEQVNHLVLEGQHEMHRAEAAEAALGLGQRQQYYDADYLSLHKAHCHTAEQLAEAQKSDGWAAFHAAQTKLVEAQRQLREMRECLDLVLKIVGGCHDCWELSALDQHKARVNAARAAIK